MRDGRSKQKGSIGELAAMYEAAKRDYTVLTPHGDFSRYDFVVERGGKSERVQVKAVTPVDGVLEVPTRTMGFDNSQDTNNRSKQNKYSADDFDWLIVYDLVNERCYFLPSSLTSDRAAVNLRLTPPKRKNPSVRMAVDFSNW